MKRQISRLANEKKRASDGQHLVRAHPVRTQVAHRAAGAAANAVDNEGRHQERSEQQQPGDGRHRVQRDRARAAQEARGPGEGDVGKEQRPGEVNLHHPAKGGSHHQERHRHRHLPEAEGRQRLEESDEEDQNRGEQVRRVGDVRGELEGPRHGHEPPPHQPPGQLGQAGRDVPGEEGEPRDGNEVQEHVRRFRHRSDCEREAHEERLQRAGNLALRPHDVRAEVRPVAGRVPAEAHQEDLRGVLEEELARQPVHEAEDEERREGGGRDCHTTERAGRWRRAGREH